MFSSDDYFVHLVSIGRRPHGEHFVLKYFDSGPVVQDEMSFEIFLIFSSGSHLVRESETI